MEITSEWLKPQYVWTVIGFALILFELSTPAFVMIFFGIGGLVVAIVCWFVDISINLQLLIFLVSSVILLASLRRSFKRLFDEKFNYQNIETEDEFIGKKAVVIKKIEATRVGKVEFRGTNWEAESTETISEGSTVKIIDKKNITLIVKPI